MWPTITSAKGTTKQIFVRFDDGHVEARLCERWHIDYDVLTLVDISNDGHEHAYTLPGAVRVEAGARYVKGWHHHRPEA